MKVLVATDLTQGHDPTDYTFCEDGELVFVGLGCASTGACGCGRLFTSMTSLHDTTTAIVAEVELDVAGYVTALREALRADGFDSFELAPDQVTTMADQLIETVRDWPVGAVVQRRGDELSIRQHPRGEVT